MRAIAIVYIFFCDILLIFDKLLTSAMMIFRINKIFPKHWIQSNSNQIFATSQSHGKRSDHQ